MLNQGHDASLFHRFIALLSCDKHQMVIFSLQKDYDGARAS